MISHHGEDTGIYKWNFFPLQDIEILRILLITHEVFKFFMIFFQWVLYLTIKKRSILVLI